MKKGFTLIEIIISIGLIVLVSATAIISFNIIKKNNKIKILENMSETIFTAANVYVETNTEIKDELYKNKNGLKIPLTTLENSGLVDFEGVELTEDDYIVTMLGTTDASSDHCAETYTAKSWNISDEVIYICEKKDGNTNLVTVAGDADNLSKASRDIYYFSGADPQNYIQLNGSGTKYQILSIDKDDSITLVKDGSFGTVFSGKTLSQTCYKNDFEDGAQNGAYCYLNASTPLPRGESYYKSVSDSECSISRVDQARVFECKSYSEVVSDYDDDYGSAYGFATTDYKFRMYGWLGSLSTDSSFVERSYKKIRLKPCMEITGGTGDFATPYKLENNCS